MQRFTRSSSDKPAQEPVEAQIHRSMPWLSEQPSSGSTTSAKPALQEPTSTGCARSVAGQRSSLFFTPSSSLSPATTNPHHNQTQTMANTKVFMGPSLLELPCPPPQPQPPQRRGQDYTEKEDYQPDAHTYSV